MLRVDRRALAAIHTRIALVTIFFHRLIVEIGDVDLELGDAILPGLDSCGILAGETLLFSAFFEVFAHGVDRDNVIGLIIRVLVHLHDRLELKIDPRHWLYK